MRFTFGLREAVVVAVVVTAVALVALFALR